jgi:hypothetical protein
MYLWQEKSGRTIDVARCRELIRELLDLGAEIRAVQARTIDGLLAEAKGGSLFRLRLQKESLTYRSLFDDVFNERDLDLFKTNDTYDRFMQIYDEALSEWSATPA